MSQVKSEIKLVKVRNGFVCCCNQMDCDTAGHKLAKYGEEKSMRWKAWRHGWEARVPPHYCLDGWQPIETPVRMPIFGISKGVSDVFAGWVEQGYIWKTSIKMSRMICMWICIKYVSASTYLRDCRRRQPCSWLQWIDLPNHWAYPLLELAGIVPLYWNFQQKQNPGLYFPLFWVCLRDMKCSKRVPGTNIQNFGRIPLLTLPESWLGQLAIVSSILFQHCCVDIFLGVDVIILYSVLFISMWHSWSSLDLSS